MTSRPTTFAASISEHKDFDPIALWASLSIEWDELPDVFLDLGDVALAEFFEELASDARWVAGALIEDASVIAN
jgi:hypothetical protein